MSQEPKYTKTILCLANSRRPSGRCVAGKEIVNGEAGSWIRPVSERNTHEITESDMAYENGQSARLLDIVSIPLLEPRPLSYQTENHLIAADYYWIRRAPASWAQVVSATDQVVGPIWTNGNSSYHGINDKVAEAAANQLPGSLKLIQPTQLDLVVGSESQYGGGSTRKVRAQFIFNGILYNFVVTDPWIEAKYFAGADGTYRINDARLCISLAEIIGGHAIKLVAAVITPDRVGTNDD